MDLGGTAPAQPRRIYRLAGRRDAGRQFSELQFLGFRRRQDSHPLPRSRLLRPAGNHQALLVQQTHRPLQHGRHAEQMAALGRKDERHRIQTDEHQRRVRLRLRHDAQRHHRAADRSDLQRRRQLFRRLPQHEGQPRGHCRPVGQTPPENPCRGIVLSGTGAHQEPAHPFGQRWRISILQG